MMIVFSMKCILLSIVFGSLEVLNESNKFVKRIETLCKRDFANDYRLDK